MYMVCTPVKLRLIYDNVQYSYASGVMLVYMHVKCMCFHVRILRAIHVSVGHHVWVGVYRLALIYQYQYININQYLSAPCARHTLGPSAPCSTVRMTKLWVGGWGVGWGES